jgi:OOP family OmpA-OmpF porin
MMKLNAMKFGVLVAAGTLPMAGAFAESNWRTDTQAYVGASYGGFKSRGDEFDDDNDFVEAVVGVRINQYFGIEAGYSYFGEFGGDFTEVTLEGYTLAGILRWPINERFGVYIKGGYMWWDSDIEVNLGGIDVGDADIDGEEPFYGVGVDFSISDHFNVAVEYSRIEVDLSDSDLPRGLDDYETDIDTIKVNAKYLF